MAIVTVYRAESTDGLTASTMHSRRWFTRQGAEAEAVKLLEDTATDIDDKDLEHGQQWTPIDYMPRKP